LVSYLIKLLSPVFSRISEILCIAKDKDVAPDPGLKQNESGAYLIRKDGVHPFYTHASHFK
jgi:hypothetical protein